MKVSVRSERGQSGLTLVELLVVMLISTVVLSGMVVIAMNTMRITRTVDVNTADQLQAQTAIAVMTRDLRAAAPLRPSDTPAFLVAEPYLAQFTANIDTISRPVLIRIELEDDGRVLETFAVPNEGELPDAGWNTDDPQVRYITSFVVNDGLDEAMIRYFDEAGNELGPASEGLTLDQRRSIAAVELSLLVSGDPTGRTTRFAVENRVRVPNR